MGVIQPVIPARPEFPRDLLQGWRALAPGVWGVLPSAVSCVYSTSACIAAGPCYFRGADVPSIAKLFQELVRVLPHSTAVGPPTENRCGLHPWARGASWLPLPGESPGAPGGAGRPAQAGVAVPGRLSPCVAPGVRSGRSAPCAGCAVAMEIACAVARQLKHPRLHTAMPRNAQLSSFLSPFCDLADMTPLALIPLHSVALLRFLGVNPVNPEKPAWHCK